MSDICKLCCKQERCSFLSFSEELSKKVGEIYTKQKRQIINEVYSVGILSRYPSVFYPKIPIVTTIQCNNFREKEEALD